MDEREEAWLMQQLAEIREEAAEACGRCTARTYDACLHQCRYHLPRIQSHREWLGPVHPGEIKEEAAQCDCCSAAS